MKTFYMLLVLMIPLSSQAQEWTAEQLEVWSRLLQCYENINSHDIVTRLSCHHKDYSGWWGEDPVPTHGSEELVKHYVENVKANMMEFYYEHIPLDIMIYGDVAILHYMLKTVTAQKDKDDKTTWIKWTDIMLKENGQWNWIADHGNAVESDD
jgi:ketosteroid isomerase-like protein